MKKINKYITEKLKLNKDIKIEDKLTDIKNCIEEFLNKLQKKFKYEIKILNIEKQSLYTRARWDNDNFVRVEFPQYITKDIFETLFRDLSRYLKDNINNLYTKWDSFLPAKGRRYGTKYIDILITKQENISEKLKLNKDTKADFDLNKISMHSKIAINHFATILKQGHYSDHYDVIADKILKWFEENNINEIEVYIDKMFTSYFRDYKNFGFKALASLDFIKFKNSFNIHNKKSNGFPKEFTILHKCSQNYEGIAYYITDELFYIDTELWDILIVDNDKQYH